MMREYTAPWSDCIAIVPLKLYTNGPGAWDGQYSGNLLAVYQSKGKQRTKVCKTWREACEFIRALERGDGR